MKEEREQENQEEIENRPETLGVTVDDQVATEDEMGG